MKFFALICTLSLTANLSCAQNNQYEEIDLSDFYDSAHHWYDINDEIKIIEPLPDQPRYKSTEIKKIADNILLFQKNNGGWAKNYDMQAILTEEQVKKVLASKDETNTTFDNGTTHSQITYLAEVYSKTKEEKYKEACIKGLEFVLKAQYSNGGFPQFYPDTSGYRKYITFNDGAMVGVMEMLKKFSGDKPEFSFIDEEFKSKITTAFNKGIDCILNSQIKENDALYAWCQQHDNITLLPQWARSFEPAAICNGESAGIVSLLMKIKNPDERIINSIQSAVRWFEESKIYGIRYQTVKAPAESYQYHTADYDRIAVEDPDAPPIWARYYELETHIPIFCNRDGVIVYSLDEVDRERRTGYAWFIDWPQEVLNKYPEWQKKYAPDENVLINTKN